ncbi:MAG: aminodeoxychorismate synthase component I [Sarcina sp.]
MKIDIIDLNTTLELYQIFEYLNKDKNASLLDSSKKESEYSRYSFIGVNPFLTFKSKGNDIYIDNEHYVGDPFEYLNKLMNEFNVEYKNDIPLISGAIGYFSYDVYDIIENIKNKKFETNYYDIYFRFYNNIIISDNVKNKKIITSINGLDSAKILKEKIENFVFIDNTNYQYNDDFSKFSSEFSKKTYMDAIKKMKEYIYEGHTYIANMTQSFNGTSSQDSYDIYKKLRKINPAPFSSYMNIEGLDIISSSPERFINILDNKVETRPIKGTMPRGSTNIEDKKNREVLENSEKDKSELLMVVDLLRNDLSKVCAPWSVNVTELFSIEEYATVFHLVSTIEGNLKKENSAVDCMKACLPGGSITGTPKFRTLEIIEELEKCARGLYTGSLGYFDFRGNCDFNIIIRTIIKENENISFGVGGGITIESIEENEYYETLDKAKALMRVL